MSKEVKMPTGGWELWAVGEGGDRDSVCQRGTKITFNKDNENEAQ